MEVLEIRFCAVAEEAPPMAEFFTKGLSLPERDLGGGEGFHGEKNYFAVAAGGLNVSFQQVLEA
jgi:hypothetical protein